MKKIKKQTLITLLTLLFILLFSGTVAAADWTVGPDGTYNYQAIQAAVQGSSDKDTITVYPNGTGVYNENVVVNKNLTLKANSSNTIVNGSFTVTASGSGSTIEGFTVNYVNNVNSNIFSENFDSVTTPTLPSGWAVVDVTGSNGNWATNVGTLHPSGNSAHSGSNLAYFNSYSASSGNNARLYRTSGIDLSGVNSAYLSFWMFHDLGYSAYSDQVQAQISTDGGNTWNAIGTVLRNDGSSGWKQQTFDISSYTGLGMTDIRIGFLGVSSYGNDCHIDDVTVGSGSSITSNPDAIYLNGASQVTVKGNTVHGFTAGNGIYLRNSNSNTITENTVSNCVNGIYAYQSNYNTLSENTVNNNSNGIYLNSNSNSNNISDNTVTDNINGIYLWTSPNNLLSGNKVAGKSTSIDGITLDSSPGNQVVGNLINGFNNGIRSNSQDAEIHFNRIVDNRNFGLIKTQGGTVNATYNWWGANSNVASKISGTGITYAPWLFMTINANPSTINNRETSQITVSFNNYSSDGTSFTSFDPATGHIPDATPVTIVTNLGSVGSSIIQKTTSNGVATATLTADATSGTAQVNGTTDLETVSTYVNINPKSSLYLNVTSSNANPLAGETVTYNLKVGNNGPDSAENVVMTYTIPVGMEFVGASDDIGNQWTYNPTTRTITWTLGTVPVGDPTLLLNLRFLSAGNFLINPQLATTTYDPTLNQNTQSITVNAQGITVNAHNVVTAKAGTVGMQTTGAPLAGIVLALCMLACGLITLRRK